MIKNTHLTNEQETGLRLDKILVQKNPEYSRQQIQSWIKNEYVTVNNIFQKPNYKIKTADKIVWHIPETVERHINPEDIPLTILYEDDYIIVINKERGMLVHPTLQQSSGTLVNALMHYSNSLSNINGEERLGIVHRLDKDTSGVMVVAKTNEAHTHLQKQFSSHTVYRKYEAIVLGVVAHDHGIIDAPIGRDKKNRLRMAVTSDGKYAETHFKVLNRFNQHSHIACELITGRTHQIRVHMKYINHPIVGDPIYSRKKSKLLDSQALFAKKLHFNHPATGKLLKFEIDQPTYFASLIKKLQIIA